MSERRIEPAGSKDFGSCQCCAGMSRRVWGYVYRRDQAEAAYFVHWTLGRLEEHGANIDVILGRWGDHATRDDRFAVSLAFRRTERGGEFMVIDAGDRPVATSELVGRALARSEVIGDPVARQVFDVVDAVWLQDERLGELTGARSETR